MNNLRINVTLGSFKVELEGEADNVISQFESIKKDGLGQIVNQLVPLASQTRAPLTIPENSKDIIHEDVKNISTLTSSIKDIALKGLTSSEYEWIIIYADDILKDGHDTFTRENLIERYQSSNRWSINNQKNLSNSIKGAVLKGWISALNDNDFILTDKGREQIQEILQRTKGIIKPPRKKTKSKKQSEKSAHE